jgi:phosphohistidine swiveling domain-containing protein
MQKPNFKRKKTGGGADYGAGWDHLLKDFYDDLDKITEDSFYSRYDESLIHRIFDALHHILKHEAIPKMLKLKDENPDPMVKENYQEWVEKATIIKTFFGGAKIISHKVIAIDSLVQFLRETSDEALPEEIRGTVASRGLAKGRVKIILDYKKDSLKMEEGDILVTDETDPTFLPIMMKAGAIITDRGGLLCHAAIVSRELKIPCIVGTEIATKVLCDDQLVEVDADKGIVRIMK